MDNVLSITNHIFPTLSIYTPTKEQGLAFMEDVCDFFVNELNFYQYGDKTELPNGQDIYYFSYTENGEPTFCFFNRKPNDYDGFFLSPCDYDGIQYLPLNYPVVPELLNKSTTICSPSYAPYLIHFGNSQYYNKYTMKDYNIIVQDVKLKDNRRIIFFKGQNKETFQYYGWGSWCGLFFTDINYKGNLIKDWVFLGSCLSTSYKTQFRNRISNNSNSGDALWLQNIQNLEEIGGILPSPGNGKDYLIKQNLYIGDDAYIPEIYKYSNLLGVENKMGKMGNIVTIKNTDYLILYNSCKIFNPYLNTVESGWGDSNAGSPVIDDLLNNICTESLIIPI